MNCSTCSGQGTIKKSENCSHGIVPEKSHFFCTIHNNNNISEYH